LLILKPGEVCQYKDKCPYVKGSYYDSCYGIESSRDKKFVCKLIDSDGNIEKKFLKDIIRTKHDI
jgi:hypothetical protein